MMNEPAQLRFDYGALDAETRQFVEERTERIHNLARMTAAGIVQIGQYLTEVKARLLHGQFLEWIEREFAWNRMSAERFMRVHEQFKMHNLCNLEIDVSALYLIAAPSTPEPVRAEVIRRSEGGEPVSHAGAHALNHEFRQNGAIPAPTKSLAQMINERRKALAAPEAPKQQLSAAERREEESKRIQREASSTRYVRLMGVIGAIETIAETPHAMSEVAEHIVKFDTPDQGWPTSCREAYSRLRSLCKELKL